MEGRRIGLALGAALLLGVAMSGCGGSGASRPVSGPEPLRQESCAEREPDAGSTSPEPTATGSTSTEPTSTEPTAGKPTPTEPTVTRLAYRGEEMADGSVRMTVGDVDAAPESPDAVRVFDFRAPDSSRECDEVQIMEVSGWWCTTTVEPIDVEGEIVLGDSEPRAQIGGEGFATDCEGERPGRLRQAYQLERDSWSGWRPYGEVEYTSWTGDPRQASEAVRELCPEGRMGTYDYQLSVRIEIDSVEVGDSLAHSAPIRTDCGTGVS